MGFKFLNILTAENKELEIKTLDANKMQNYRSFFLSKYDFRCQSCKPATDKHTTIERKLRPAILEFVD